MEENIIVNTNGKELDCGALTCVKGKNAFKMPFDFFNDLTDDSAIKIITDAFCNKTAKKGAETLYATVPAEKMQLFEDCGFRRNGIVFSYCGHDCINMGKDLVFDGIDFITFERTPGAVFFRNDFDFGENIKTVKADILPLGFFECLLNGKKISDDFYAPAWTNYSELNLNTLSYPISDTLCYRSYYMHYDLTPWAKSRMNTLVIHIGDGWYGQWESRNENVKAYGVKKLCFKITVEKTDGTKLVFSSNDGGFYKESYITRSSMYFGEEQNLNLCDESLIFSAEDDKSAYKPVIKAEKPYTLAEKQTCPPDRILRKTGKAKVLYSFGDTKIYDTGENLAGFAVLKFSDGANINDRVMVRYAENLNEDGSLNFNSTGGTNRLSVDVFRSGKRHEDRLLYPRFLWHTGRYIEVTGKADFLYYCLVATDIPVKAEFRSSDEALNWLFDSYIRTQSSNIHTCVPSDCPHRERLGYTGDGQLTAAAVMTAYDAKELYRKWMRDIADSQDIYGGHVNHTAPFYGGGGGPGGWGCAIVEVPYRYRKYYGENDVLEEYYPNMVKYLEYLGNRSDDHIVMRGEPGGWCLGDWCMPDKMDDFKPIPEPFVNTYFYIRSIRQVKEAAEILGKEEDKKRLETLEKAVCASFVGRFKDENTGSFCEGCCGADAFALDLGLGDERTKSNLINRYRKLKTFDTGIFGTPLVIKALFELGRGDNAYKLLTNHGEVSFRNMMNAGATTLWEDWYNRHSSSHPMFGAVTEYLFRYILGITQPENSCGYEKVEIKPVPAPSLDWAEGTVYLGGKKINIRVEKGKLVKSDIKQL